MDSPRTAQHAADTALAIIGAFTVVTVTLSIALVGVGIVSLVRLAWVLFTGAL